MFIMASAIVTALLDDHGALVNDLIGTLRGGKARRGAMALYRFADEQLALGNVAIATDLFNLARNTLDPKAKVLAKYKTRRADLEDLLAGSVPAPPAPALFE